MQIQHATERRGVIHVKRGVVQAGDFRCKSTAEAQRLGFEIHVGSNHTRMTGKISRGVDCDFRGTRIAAAKNDRAFLPPTRAKYLGFESATTLDDQCSRTG